MCFPASDGSSAAIAAGMQKAAIATDAGSSEE